MSLWFGTVCWKRRRSTRSCGSLSWTGAVRWVCLHPIIPLTTWSSTTKRTTSTTRDCSVSSASGSWWEAHVCTTEPYVTLAPIMQLEGGNNKQQVLEKQWYLQTCQPVCMLSSKYTLSLLTTKKPGDASVHVQDCKKATAEDEFDQSEHLSRFAFK